LKVTLNLNDLQRNMNILGKLPVFLDKLNAFDFFALPT